MIKTRSTATSGFPLRAPNGESRVGIGGGGNWTDAPLTGDELSAFLSRLASLPFVAFAAFVTDILKAAGYENVQARGRSRFLGKNSSGGIDLTATLPGSLGIRPVIAQIKQFAPGVAIHQKCIDELRGACLRAGAAEALVVTTGRIAPLARENAIRSAHSVVAPIRALDGEALARLAVRYGVGTVVTRDGKAVMDAAYFETLAKRFAGVQRRERVRSVATASPSAQPPARPPVGPAPAFAQRMAGPVTVTVVVREGDEQSAG